MQILLLQEAEVAQERDALRDRLSDLEGVELRFAGSIEEALLHTDTEAVICPVLPGLPALVDGLPRLRWIHFLSAGVDGIWAMPFDKSRYLISKSTGVHAATISEYVLGAVIYVLKGFGRFQQNKGKRKWEPLWLEECAGKALTIVGLGKIGSCLARRAKLFGMTVVGVVSSMRDIEGVDMLFQVKDLNRAVSNADFVALLVPLTDRTRKMFGRDAFNAMKPGAWLVNVARGEVVDEPAMIEALQHGGIGGAVLDVFEEEPLPQTSPLWDMENVLITPHVAGGTQHYMAHALDIFKENFRQLKETGELTTPVSVEKGY